MRYFMALITALSFPVISLANDSQSYAHGKDLGKSLIQGPSAANPNETPFYQGSSIPESHYQENFHKMGDAATTRTHDPQNETGAAVINSQRERLEHDFRITEKDPLIQLSNEINKDPIAVIGGTIERDVGDVTEVIETTHVCEESAEEATYSCDQTRQVFPRLLQKKAYINTHYHGWKGDYYSYYRHTPDVKEFSRRRFDGCNWWADHAVHNWRIYDGLEDHPESDVIEDQCAGHEQQANKGLCRYGEEEILEGPGTREFCKGDDCISIYRDWWKRRRTYHCQYPSKDNCGPLRAAGCEQIKSACKTRVGSVCVDNQKTFLCRSQKLGNGITKMSGDVPFCLDGNCDDRSWSPNTNFADAMSKLSIFREMAKDMDAQNATVFRGEALKCSKATLSFKDCCGRGGWGRSVGLAHSCKEEEKNLQKERQANKCVRIGTYCSQKDKVTKVCLIKKTSFCCFGSKLAKIVHEQGRKQLGIGWGSAKNPECRPFNVTELQKIDFSKIDLRELFSEIRAKTTMDNVTKAASTLGEDWQSKVQATKEKAPHSTAKASNRQKEKSDASL